MLAIAAALAACGTDRAPTPRGRWHGGAGAPAASAPQAAPLGPWEHHPAWADFRHVGAVGRSQHLASDAEGELYANEVASSYPALGPARRLPPGSILVEALRGGGGRPVDLVLGMVKRAPGYDPAGEDWEYVVVAPNGLLQARGPIPACARCHAEAPVDRVFGPGTSAAAGSAAPQGTSP